MTTVVSQASRRSRSCGGWRAVKAMRGRRVHAKGDERILGQSDFVVQVLKEHNEQLEKRTRILSLSELSQGSRLRSVVRARSVLCYWRSSNWE